MVYLGELILDLYMGNMYSHLFRQEFPVSGQMTAGISSWNTWTQSVTLLPRYTILLSHFPLPRLGCTSATVQNSQERSR